MCIMVSDKAYTFPGPIVQTLICTLMCRNPLKFKSIECNLLERVNVERTREDRGSQTEEDEDD